VILSRIVAFRNDHEALLARAEALERRVAELETERDRAVGEAKELRAELERTRAELDKLERARRRKSPAEADEGWTWLQSRAFANLVGPAALLVAAAVVVGFAMCRGDDRTPDSPTKEPAVAAEPASGPPASATNQAVSRRQVAAAIRYCFDRADLVVRASIGGGRISPQYDEVHDAATLCVGSLDALTADQLAATPELEPMVAPYRDAVDRFREAWQGLLRVIGSGDASGPGGAEFLAGARAAVAEAAGPFLASSRSLRLTSAALLDEQVGLQRPAGSDADPSALARFEVAVRTAALLDAIALGSAAEVQEALDAYLEARRDAAYRESDAAITFTKFIREAAGAVIAARAGDAVPDGDAGPIVEAEDPNPVLPVAATHPLTLATSYLLRAGLRIL
jgi:hypothetical protein